MDQTRRKKAVRLVELVLDIERTPFAGIGKPEPLKHEYSGCWSRRIDQEHRVVYEVLPDKIRILACVDVIAKADHPLHEYIEDKRQLRHI